MSRLWLLAAIVAAGVVTACTGRGDSLTVNVDEGEDTALDDEAGTVGGPPGPVGPDAW